MARLLVLICGLYSCSNEKLCDELVIIIAPDGCRQVLMS